LKGAWVWKVNNDGGTHRVSYVHGNYTITENETITDAPNDDGLTVMEGATLTINNGVTLTVNDDAENGIPQITNNGTVVNNGTIQFQTTATDDTILALTKNGGTLTGSGVVKRGDTEVAPINGVVYEVNSNVSTTGLDLFTSTPTENTCYKAGSGYILWQPTVNGGTVTLQNASINTANKALNLPGTTTSAVDITIVVEGENSLISSDNHGIYHVNGETLIQGSGTLNAQSQGSALSKGGIYQPNGAIAITGDVTVNATGGNNGFGICSEAQEISILGNASVTATGGYDGIWAGGNITINTTGTVNVPKLTSIQYVIYTSGTITGSWVYEGKDDEAVNHVNTIYGNVVLTADKTMGESDGEDGLTIMQGASLTINEGVTFTVEDDPEAEGIPKVTNNGTIVNNGTIKFPEGTTSAEIEALNITGNGTIKIGDKDVAIVNGVLYPVGGDIGNVGVDFTVDTPTVDTYYKAGEGYVIFSPTNGTLTMNNAAINVDQEKPLIILPQSNLKLVLEGENTLTNLNHSQNVVAAIQQGEVLESSDIAPQAYSLTVSGNGTLSVKNQPYKISSISTDGTFVMESGTLQSLDAVGNCFSLTTADFQMKGGSLEVSSNLTILGNALIQGGRIYTPGSDGYIGIIGCMGNFEMTGGTVTCGVARNGGLVVYGNITKTGGALNALVGTLEMNDTNGVFTYTPYGSAPMVVHNNAGSEDITQKIILYLGNLNSAISFKLNIPSDSTLTIPSGAILNMSMYVGELNISEFFTNNGTLVNNGKIVLPIGSTAEEVKAAAAILKATGTGVIEVPMEEMSNFYTNSGEPMNWVNDISLGETETSGDGYTWVGNTTDGFTLTLDSVYVESGDINLPSNVPITIALEGNSMANAGIMFTHSGEYADPCNLTFSGSGTLTLNGGISGGGSNGDIVTVQGGANVDVEGGINIGGSGGQDGTLIVDGTGTTLNVTNQMGTGVYLDRVQVLNGAQMTVHSDTEGIFAGDGGVTVTGGSTLNVGCDYGVYIIDGKLNIDKTSKLITNGAIAPFCVVDTTKSKAQGDAVSLPGIPSGTKITSAQGSLGNYWSLVPTGGTLGVTDENSEPVTLSGAVKGIVTFEAAKTRSDDGGGSATYHIITATAQTNGSISPSGNVNVVSDGSKTFTITADEGYAVKDVLVDGVSVGAVTTYTFDKVIKAHTITASFEEIHSDVDSLYNDVKDSDWFKTAVDYVTEKGLMAGTGDGEFGPYISTDRGMIVTILWRLEGQPSATAESSFTDVAQGEYYTDAVAWAAENKIVEGYGNGIFGPKDTITREQMAAILYRYSKFKNYDTTQGGMAVREFSDYGKISDWALESVGWAVNSDLISGVGCSQLDPCGSATRAQVASILMRYCENIVK